MIELQAFLELFTLESMTLFWIYGLRAYTALFFINFLVLLIKFSNLEPLEKEEFLKFRKICKETIIQNNLTYLVWIRIVILIVMPMYNAFICFVFLFVMLTRTGLWGLISACIISDGFHFITMVKYDIENSDK
jgi:hypothetical protein